MMLKPSIIAAALFLAGGTAFAATTLADCCEPGAECCDDGDCCDEAKAEDAPAAA